MLIKLLEKLLDGVVWTLERLVRLCTPGLGFGMLGARGLYGAHPWHYRRAGFIAPGWLCLQLGSWSIEVGWRTREERRRAREGHRA